MGATSLKGGTAVGTVPLVPYNAPTTSGPLDYRAVSRLQAGQYSNPNDNNSNGSNSDRRGADPSTLSCGQLHPPRNIVVQDETDLRFLSEDPFFLLGSLLTTSALSFVQLLNYLSVCIDEDRSTEIALLNVKLERLGRCVKIISRVESALAENMHWIVQGGCHGWPRVSPGSDTSARKEALQTRLRVDHEALQRRCVIMRQDCESAMVFLVSYSQLLCGEQGIAQAGEVNRLTRLASFFVPIAFVTSGFGMNVREIQDNFPGLVWFFVVAIVVSAATYGFMFWSAIWNWVGKKREIFWSTRRSHG